MSKHQIKTSQFRPSAAMVAMADACFIAIANESYVRGIVESYRSKVLREREYLVAADNLGPEDNGKQIVIRYIADAFLMSEEDFNQYHQLCLEEQAKSGLTSVKENNCPLSEASHATRVAKHALFDSLSFITGVTAAKCIETSYPIYQEMMELILDLFANHVSDAPELLARVMSIAAQAPEASQHNR